MYATPFVFDVQLLEQLYPNATWRNAYSDVRPVLEANGFENRQDPVSLSVDDIDAADKYEWFVPSLKLRIEETTT